MRVLKIIGILLAAMAFTGPVTAQDEIGFQSYLQDVRGRAIAQGVRPATADQVLAGLTYNQRVVDLDRNQPVALFQTLEASLAEALGAQRMAARIEPWPG